MGGVCNYYYDGKDDEHVIPILARTQTLMRRFVGIEEAHEDIFDMYVTAMDLVIEAKESEAYLVESLMACRVLRILGFLTDDGFPREIMSPYNDFSPACISGALPYRKKINSRINVALRESGLL